MFDGTERKMGDDSIEISTEHTHTIQYNTTMNSFSIFSSVISCFYQLWIFSSVYLYILDRFSENNEEKFKENTRFASLLCVTHTQHLISHDTNQYAQAKSSHVLCRLLKRMLLLFRLVIYSINTVENQRDCSHCVCICVRCESISKTFDKRKQISKKFVQALILCACVYVRFICDFSVVYSA